MSKRRGQDGQVFLRHGNWIGRYYEDVFGQPNRVRRAVVLGTRKQLKHKTAARQRLRAIIEEKGVNTEGHLLASLTPPRPQITFNSICDAWVAGKLPMLKISTQSHAPTLINKHLRPFFGPMAPAEIKTGTVNQWLAQMNGLRLQPKTVHNAWKQFRAIMNWHAQQNDAPKRVWYPSLPIIPDVEQRWFAPDEIRLIVDAAKGQYRVLFHLAGFSGLRFGELAGVHVDDLDLDRGVIHVRRSVWRGQEITTKTRRGCRSVWIDSITIAMLREHLGTRRSGRLFETKNGTPLENHNVVRQVLKPICRRLGIVLGGMHAFRHGRVSQMQTAGVPADFVKHQVGHSSLNTTSGYTHFSDDFKRQIVEKLASNPANWTHSTGLDSLGTAAN